MSCDHRTKQFLAHPSVTGPGTAAATTFGSSEAAQQAFEEVFDIARSRPVPTATQHQQLIEAQTRMLFLRMQRLNIKPPAHSKTGLPKRDAQQGYAELWRTLQALEQGKPLPELAQAVLINQRRQGQALTGNAAAFRRLAEQTRTNSGDVDPQAVPRLLDALSSLTFGQQPPEQVIQPFVANLLGHEPATTQIERVKGEGAKGVSGSPVYFVRNAAGARIGVTKVYPNPDEFARELSALERLNAEDFQSFQAPRALGAAQVSLPKGRGAALVLSMASGTSLDDLIIRAGRASGSDRRAAIAELQQAVEHTAEALAELHTKPDGSGRPVAPAFLDRHIGALRDITAKLRANPYVSRLPGFDGDTVQRRVDALIADVQRSAGGAALVHGDAHPGNFFYASDEPVTMIDVPTLHLSMDAKGAPIGAPARDVTNFEQKLVHFGQTYGLTQQENLVLLGSFQERYQATGAPLTREALAFFRARTAVGELLKIAAQLNADLTQTATLDQALREQFAIVQRELQLGA